MNKTSFKYTVFALIFAFTFSCISPKQRSNKGKIQWGMYYWEIAETDSTYSRKHGIKANYDCLPDSTLLSPKGIARTIKIFNRLGEKLYDSNTGAENWICNSQDNDSFTVDTYYFLVYDKSLSDSSIVDTIEGTITLYRRYSRD